MELLRLGLRFFAAMFSTLWSRLRHGPARPSWTFIFEALVLSLRRTSDVFGRRSPLEQRVAWRAIAQPNALRREIRVEGVNAGGVPAKWAVPTGVGADAPVLVYFHGGSYRYGAFETHAELVSRLGKAAGTRVLFVDYRLAPPDRFPAAVEDGVKALRWVCGTVDPSRVVVAGDSAGGGLAVAALLALRDAQEPLPAAGLLICPWVDLSARGGSLETNARWDWAKPEHFIDWAKGCAEEAQWKDSRLSPTFANLAGLPPLLIQVGEVEMLLDQVQAFAAKAQAAGGNVQLTVEPDMVHDWHVLGAFTPVAQKSIDEAGAFVRLSFRGRSSSRTG